MKQQVNVGVGIKGVKYHIDVKRFGEKYFKRETEGHNLVLDTGLDLWASNWSTSLITYCKVGTGTTPVERDSATTTASQSGTTVTASGAFFEAGDVGRLLKFNSGEEVYITSFTSATEVEVDTSQTVSSSEFTIYYVNQTGLVAQTATTNSVVTGASNNNTSESAGVITHKRTLLFSAVGAPVGLNEIGFAPASGGNLFNRAIFPSTVNLGTGDQLRVTAFLEIVQSPQTSIPQTDVGAGGFNSTGDIQIEGYGMAAFTSTGQPNANLDASAHCFEPSQNFGINVALTDQTNAFNSYGTVFTEANGGWEGIQSVSLSSYSNGNFYRDKTAVFSTSNGNSSNINSIMLCYQNGGAANSCLRVKLDAAQQKLNTETLTITFRLSWQRVLTNS